MKKEIIVAIVCLCCGVLIGLGTNVNNKIASSVNAVENEKINFVELYFPNLFVDSNPLGQEVFALSFVVEQKQFGYQNYGGRYLVAEVVKGPYNYNRILGMKYNYFVYPDEFTNFNVTLVIRNGELIDYEMEKYPTNVVWGRVNLTLR